jgi:hypothetical protein
MRQPCCAPPGRSRLPGIQGDLHPLLVEKVMVAHLAVRGHLQVLVFYLRMHLSVAGWGRRGILIAIAIFDQHRRESNQTVADRTRT